MSNVLQLSVKLLVCGYYGAFQTLRTAIRTCIAFCFLPDVFYIVVEPKLMMLEAVHAMPSLYFHERIFSSTFGDNISLVGMSW